MNTLLVFLGMLASSGTPVQLGPSIPAPAIVTSIGTAVGMTVTVPFSFDSEAIKIYPSPVAGYCYLKLEDVSSSGKPGTPALPVKTFVVPLPGECEVSGITLVDCRFREIENPLAIVPHSQPVPRKEKEKNYYQVDERVYSQSTFYPGQAVFYETGKDREKTYCFVRLYPVQYLPVQKKGVLLTGGRLLIHYRVVARGKNIDAASSCVIICPKELESSADNLKNFHLTELGITTTVVATDWIGSNYPPALEPDYLGYTQNKPSLIQNYDFTLARKIVSYLRDSAAHPNLGYVVILGDGAQVPPSYYFLMDPSGASQADFWAPSDLLYASPDYDFVPNFRVGRLPVSDTAESNALVAKLAGWFPAQWSWFGKAKLAGSDPFPDYYPYYDEALVAQAVNQESFNGFAIDKFLRSDDKFTEAAVGPELAAGGFGVFFETGHGSGAAIALDDGSISADEVLAYPKQTNLPVVMSPACDIGAFDTDLVPALGFATSFGEALLKSKGGAIGFFGSSRLGNAGFEYYIDNGNLVITHRDCADAIFIDNIKAYHNGARDLGSIYEQSIVDFIGDNDMTDTLNQWTVFSFVLLGDPALKLPAPVSGPNYQLPRSTIPSPTYHNGNGYPVCHIGEQDSVSVNSTTDAPGVRYKLCNTTRAGLALDQRSDGSVPFSYSFKPVDGLALYLVRGESGDGKEGWFYVYATTGKIVVDGDKKDWERAGLSPVAVDPSDFNPPDYDILNLYATDDGRNWYFGFDALACDTISIAYGIAVDGKSGGYTGTPGQSIDGFDNWLTFGPDHPVDYEIFVIPSGNSMIPFMYPWGDTDWLWGIYLPDSGSFAGFDSTLNFMELSVPKKLLGDSKTLALSLFSCGYDYNNQEHSPALDAAPSDPATFHQPVFGKQFANTITRFAIVTAVGIREQAERFAIHWQAGPNPFSKAAVIQYQLPVSAWTSLKVYDRTGRLVRGLVDGHKPAGVYTVRWDGKDDAGIQLPSGVYFYRLEVGKEVFIKKAVLVR